MRSRDSNSFVSVKSHSFDVNQKACDMAHGFEARKRVSYHVVLKGNEKLVSHGNETRNVQKFVGEKNFNFCLVKPKISKRLVNCN